MHMYICTTYAVQNLHANLHVWTQDVVGATAIIKNSISKPHTSATCVVDACKCICLLVGPTVFICFVGATIYIWRFPWFTYTPRPNVSCIIWLCTDIVCICVGFVNFTEYSTTNCMVLLTMAASLENINKTAKCNACTEFNCSYPMFRAITKNVHFDTYWSSFWDRIVCVLMFKKEPLLFTGAPCRFNQCFIVFQYALMASYFINECHTTIFRLDRHTDIHAHYCFLCT